MNIFINVYLCISSCPHPAIVPMTHLTGNKDEVPKDKGAGGIFHQSEQQQEPQRVTCA